MRQLTLARQAEFQRYAKKTRREQFLEEMEAVMPWGELLALVAPQYSQGEAGRKPVGLEIMLRVYFLQQWFALSDPGAEDALYESPVLRRFAGIDLGRAPTPDETTILNFRHLLEEHALCGEMLEAVNVYLEGKGIRITTGTIVDATIIHAPSSTKNEKKERDPAMHQTKKGNQWYFGMKAHIGVDSKEGTVHSLCSTAANVHDKHMLLDLLHGEEKKVWGDAGYQGQTEAIHEAAPLAQDMTSRRVKTKSGVDEEQKRKNRTKARVRAKVEWPFRVLKRVFGLTKVRYRGLKKNHEWLCAAFASINIYQHRASEKRENICASLVAQLWNARVSDRKEIEKRTIQYNRLAESHNVEIERGLMSRSGTAKGENEAASKLQRAVKDLAEPGPSPKGAAGKIQTAGSVGGISSFIPDQQNLLLHRRIEAMKNTEANLKERLNRTTQLLEQERSRNQILKGA